MIAPAKPAVTGTRYAVAYCRFSPRSKSAECPSCEIQLQDIRAYCERNNITLRGEYRDDAVSGKSVTGRLGLAAAVAAVKRGDLFLCRDTSRLSRDMIDSFKLATQIVKKGAILQTLNDGTYDPNDPNSILGFGVRAVMNHVQRLQISKATRAKMLKHQSEGNRRMSKTIMYGKMADPADPRRTLDCPAEAAVIAQIVELRSTGLSAQGIADKLHGLNTTFRGRPWQRGTIRKILKREGVGV